MIQQLEYCGRTINITKFFTNVLLHKRFNKETGQK
jgi:hypothetical protein